MGAQAASARPLPGARAEGGRRQGVDLDSRVQRKRARGGTNTSVLAPDNGRANQQSQERPCESERARTQNLGKVGAFDGKNRRSGGQGKNVRRFTVQQCLEPATCSPMRAITQDPRPGSFWVR